LFAGKFVADVLSFLAGNSAGKFPTDFKNCRKISCGFQKPQETITYEGFSWEPKSAGNSAGNVFPADFLSKSAGKSAGKKHISSSEHFGPINVRSITLSIEMMSNNIFDNIKILISYTLIKSLFGHPVLLIVSSSLVR
jgi:hypothetical protein